jgi:oxaloacetate decarboxylase gamma subunit
MEVSLISQGVDLMLFGMGTVFTFLTLLVGLTTLMSFAVNRYAKEESITGDSEAHQIHTALVEPKIVKVIQAAIDQHRGS